MSFGDASRPPVELRTDEFLLRPIRASDAALDHEAVMESKDFLRPWEQSGWPVDDFTVEANCQDLDTMERRHAAGERFAYTVMNPTETQCLGCVYILPTTASLFTKAQISAVDGSEWSAYEAAVYFWVRTSRLDDRLDRRLLHGLCRWLKGDWRFRRHLTVTNEQVQQQVSMIETAGLTLAFRLTRPDWSGDYLAYSDTSPAV